MEDCPVIVYQITQLDAQRGSVRHWAKSKADLSSIKAKVRAKYRANGNPQDFNGWGGPFKHEIDKGKDGVVEFLNLHAGLDNG
jgi:hypothetical protein